MQWEFLNNFRIRLFENKKKTLEIIYNEYGIQIKIYERNILNSWFIPSQILGQFKIISIRSQ